MTEFERAKAIHEMNILLNRARELANYIVDSIKADRAKEKAA